MFNNPLQSLGAFFFTTVGLVVLWFVALPSSVETIREFEEARDLHAWLQLRNLFTVSTINVFYFGPNECISEYPVIVKRGLASPRPQLEMVKLAVSNSWPRERTCRITLEPMRDYMDIESRITERARVYRVKTHVRDLPFSDYLVVCLKDRRTFFFPPKEDYTSNKMSTHSYEWLGYAALGLSRPRCWARIETRFRSLGFDGEPQDLKLTDAALEEFTTASDDRIPKSGVQVLGLRLSVSQFHFGIGLLLAPIAFMSLGPTMALHRLRTNGSSPEVPDTSWIMALYIGGSSWARVLEFAILIMSFIWVLSPIAVLIFQVLTIRRLELSTPVVFLAGGLGLFFSAVVFFLTSRELFHVRRAQQKVTHRDGVH